MKKTKILLLLLLCLLVFTGCLSNPTEDQVKQTEITAQQTQENQSLVQETLAPVKKGQSYTNVTAKVNRVIDGDTLELIINNNKTSVRLLLVDTPETVKPRTPVQPFGKDASNFTKELLTGKTVELEMQSNLDKYGRGLAYVYVNGKSVQEELLTRGLARIAYVYVKNAPHLDQYKSAELKAKSKGIGIWSIPNYVQSDGFHPEVVK